MANKNNRPTLLVYIIKLSEAFFLKICISDSENLVNNKNFRIQMSRNCKSKPHIHAAGIPLYRSIDELSDFGKLHNLIKLGPNFSTAHPKNCPVEKNVLSPGEFRMKPGTNFQQA